MNQIIEQLEREQQRSQIPDFEPGDTVRVHVRIKEGDKERLQIFEGVVLAKTHGGLRETITVRKTSFGIGVERSFPLHATIVDHIDVVKRGRVRRAKLYYLRGRVGRRARIREQQYVGAEPVEEPLEPAVAADAAGTQEEAEPVEPVAAPEGEEAEGVAEPGGEEAPGEEPGDTEEEAAEEDETVAEGEAGALNGEESGEETEGAGSGKDAGSQAT